MKDHKKILLLGGSGNLGSSIIKSGLFKNLYHPSKKKLNILNCNQIRNFLRKKNFDLIINCAAMARIVDCEKKISKAIEVNVGGTFNLVKEIIKHQDRYKKKIKLIHISSDAVYPSLKGNYSEKDSLGPYNVYGWTKLSSEFLVKLLDSYVIIRTRFFDKKKIVYKKSAIDLFTSNIEVNDLVKKIKMISLKNYVGVINVGLKRHSDYAAYKLYKKNLKGCKRKDIIKNLKINLAKDSSMKLELLKRIEKRS